MATFESRLVSRHLARELCDALNASEYYTSHGATFTPIQEGGLWRVQASGVPYIKHYRTFLWWFDGLLLGHNLFCKERHVIDVVS